MPEIKDSMGGSPLFAGGLQMETEKRTEEQKRTEALALLKSILEIPSVNGKDREQETAVYLAE